jgi:thiamine kinase-like enzyme
MAYASHNDIHQNNMLYTPPSTLNLIDFEYCSLNYRAFDLATFVYSTVIDYAELEFPFLKIYRDNILPEHKIDLLLESYLITYYQNYYLPSQTQFEDDNQHEQYGESKYDDSVNEQQTESVYRMMRFLEEEKPKLREELEKMLPMPYLIWSVWSVMMIDFENYDETLCMNFDMANENAKIYKDYVNGVF